MRLFTIYQEIARLLKKSVKTKKTKNIRLLVQLDLIQLKISRIANTGAENYHYFGEVWEIEKSSDFQKPFAGLEWKNHCSDYEGYK